MRRVAAAVKHWKGAVLAFPRKGAKTRRRLERCLGIAWQLKLDAAVRCRSQCYVALAQISSRTLQWFGCSSPFGVATSGAAAARVQQRWWQGARSLPLCATGVAATAVNHAAAEACVCAWSSHDSLTLTGAYRLEPRRRGDVQLLDTDRRGHGLQSIGLRGSRWCSTGCNLFGDSGACVSRERSRANRPLSTR